MKNFEQPYKEKLEINYDILDSPCQCLTKIYTWFID